MNRLRLPIVLALLTVTGTALGAQTSGAVIPSGLVGLGAGMSIPAGSLNDGYSAGFNLSGLVELRAPQEAVGVRAELLWERFEPKEDVTAIENKNAVAVVLNAMYFVPEYALRPYFIGGMGFYHVSDQGNRPGLNFGMGLDIPLSGMAAHLEVRLHKVLTDGNTYSTVPIAFGVKF